jgi:hypothetical protein
LQHRGSVRTFWGGLLVFLGLLLRPLAASAMLAGPSLHGLAVSAHEVAVRVGSRILFFDHDGNFRREMTSAGVKLEDAHLLTLTDDGRLWLSYAAEDKDGKITTMTLASLDDSGEVVASRRLDGERTFYVTPRGAVYAGQVEAPTKRLSIARLDTASGRRTPHAAVAIENPLRVLDLDTASAVEWAVDDAGDLFVLTTAAERGRVTQYHPSGEQVRTWDVLPDPVTSVSYLKNVLLDREGVPYVTHSSWEVSSATSNSGSVIRLDPAGGEPLRFMEGIDYLQDAAIAPSGDVFVTDLSEEVARFAPSGERLLSWVAVPPRAGETWEGRRQHISDACRAGPDSSVPDLVDALVYGDWASAQKVRRWLLAKGPSAVPDVTAAVARLDRVPALRAAAEELWEAQADATVRLFVETKDEAVRRLLATHLAWTASPPPGVRELLSRMVLEGDDTARHALGNMGLTPEVVALRIAQLRKDLGKDDRAGFDARWDLTRGYPASIGALEAILTNRDDPDRGAFRSLILEASLETTHEPDGKPKAVPPEVVTRTQGWATHQDPFVRETAAIALTAFGVVGHEREAIAAATRDATLVEAALKAFAVLSRSAPDAVTPHVPALLALARSQPASEYQDLLGKFADIPNPAVLEASIGLVGDRDLPVSRRAAVLSNLRPKDVPRASLVELLRDLGWQRPLVTQYSYHSFVEDVLKEYPTDAGLRRGVRDALMALLAEPQDRPKRDPSSGPEARAILLGCLGPLITNADAPTLTSLLADPTLDRATRWQAMRLVSLISPDDALRERLVPLLHNQDYRLVAAQALGRIGEPAALEVLVEHGLKRLGYYSDVELDIESFRPLGADAEEALISLLDYPNEGTRQLVRLFLVQWPSAEGRRRIRADFDRAIAAGHAAQSYDLAALASAGEPIVEPLVNLAMKHPEEIEDLGASHERGPLDDQIGAALSRETDPARIAVLKKIAGRLCGCSE